MPLDPVLAHILPAIGTLAGPGGADATPATARARFRMLSVDSRRPEDVIAVGGVEDRQVAGADGPLAARLYRPEAEGTRPLVVFFHGGGFVIGDLDTHDDQARLICRETAAVVLSVAYRLAPEAPWPAAVEDCVAATRWAAGHARDLGADEARVGVAGDSAGGNLAAVVAQELRDRVAAQLLLYPVVDHDARAGAYPSRADNAEGYFLTTHDMRWFDGQYTSGVADRAAPRLSPLRGELAGAPPAVVVTAEFDPLRDEGDAYAAALRDAGVEVVHHAEPGLIHGFFGFGAVSPAAAAAGRRACASFRALLERS